MPQNGVIQKQVLHMLFFNDELIKIVYITVNIIDAIIIVHNRQNTSYMAVLRDELDTFRRDISWVYI